MLVLPRIGSPASLSLRTTVASYGGTQPSRIFEPHVVGRPSVASTSLTAMGTPSSAEARRPAARRSSDARAAASAPSASTWRKACTCPSTAEMRSRKAWVSSTLVVSPAARASARAAALRWISGSFGASAEALTARPPGCGVRRSAGPRRGGAPESACAALREGRTSSGRKTLVTGSGCDVGGMSSAAASLIEATDSRITESCGARWSSSASSSSMRARSARWRTSSRLMSGMGVILVSDHRRLSRPRPGRRHPGVPRLRRLAGRGSARAEHRAASSAGFDDAPQSPPLNPGRH